MRRRLLLASMGAAAAAGIVGCSSETGSGGSGAPSSTPSSSRGSTPTGSGTPSRPDSPTTSPSPRAELPGGGRSIFPSRRIVALYGRPGASSMGALGEQGTAQSVRRVKKLTDRYAKFAAKPIMPAFELIATMGTQSAGPSGDYSSPMSAKSIRPWLDAARRAGVYVVLDLQPGRADFLDQAQRYGELLQLPHVGLALDPEWKLTGSQRPMQQIGSVDSDEINSVITWLAHLTKSHDLPQKTLLIHQFRTSMVAGRDDLDTGHRELAVVIHADGHGSPKEKRSTYRRMHDDLPAHTWMGWKNFFQQDHPMFTPKQTYGVKPKPWFVSYQ